MIRFASPLLLLLVVAALLPMAWAPRAGRRRIAVRAAAVLLAVAALADPRWIRVSDRNNVVFLIDRSPSVERSADARATQARVATLAQTNPTWRYAVVSFASDAGVDSPLGAQPRVAETPPNGEATRLAEAVRLGLALIPEGEPGQLVVFSDGRFDDAEEAAAEAALAGVPIHGVPAGERLAHDARVVELEAPPEVSIGRPVALRGVIASTGSGSATLALYRNGWLAEARTLDLAEGETVFTFVDSPTAPGLIDYRVVVKAEGDPVQENDARSALVRTTDRPSILVVDALGDSAVPALLDAAGIPFVETASMPGLSSLADVRQVILAGVSLPDLTSSHVASLEHFVRDLGGGLLVLHGEDEAVGFERGGIEPLLPVSFSVPETAREPSLAVVFLLDRSSSMGELAAAKRKIRVVREAAAASLLILPPETLVGIIAFYDAYDWVFPLQPLGDGSQAYLALSSIEAFGGTDLYGPLDDAVDRLLGTPARVKHLILISDGQTTEVGRDYPSLFGKLGEHPEITLSAIAVSSSPNVSFLERLADAAHGEIYYATDFATLPQVALRVTQRLGRSRFVRGAATVAAHGGFSTLPPIPPISGYVLTYPRPESTTLLGVGDDPLFATWRVGLGAVSLLNTDLRGLWTREWMTWDGAARLFEQMLATTEPLVAPSEGFVPSVALSPLRTQVYIDARTSDGGFADLLSLSASLVPTALDVALRQVAPGFYRGEIPTPPEGAYALVGRDAGSGRSFTLPVTIPYSPEYDVFGVDAATLTALAETTRGRVLSETDSLTPSSARGPAEHVPLAPLFLGLSLVAFLADLGLRRRSPHPD
ncbi:MAG: vWA domain-containing protein [Candidatus Bipolaricaulota bacterium]